MKRYLIAVDLDGTLLYDFDTLDDQTVAFMRRVVQMGHKIVIATGRPFRSSRFVHEKFGLDTPIINYNGGLITNPRDPSFPTVNYTVPKEAIIDIFESNVELIRNAFSEVKDDIFLFQEEAAIEPLLHRTADSTLQLGHLKDTLKTDPNGFIIIGKPGTGKAIEAYVHRKYEGKVLSRIWHFAGEFDSILEIFTPESNKGKALAYVAEHLGFAREDIVAIGDGHNDLEMIRYAGLGVTVKNAHPEMLQTADLILPHTAQDGAVRLFLTQFLGLK
jgi:Cof subfamily protein (haloacid dehalogenase superfamily)